MTHVPGHLDPEEDQNLEPDAIPPQGVRPGEEEEFERWMADLSASETGSAREAASQALADGETAVAGTTAMTDPADPEGDPWYKRVLGVAGRVLMINPQEGDILASVVAGGARVAPNIVKGLSETGADALAFVSEHVFKQKETADKLRDWEFSINENLLQYLPEPTTTLGHLTEELGTFIAPLSVKKVQTSIMATKLLVTGKLGKTAGTVAGSALGLAYLSAVDATVFSPHDPTGADLAEGFGQHIPLIGGAVQRTGEFFSVDEGDDPAVARMKRFYATFLTFGMIDAVARAVFIAPVRAYLKTAKPGTKTAKEAVKLVEADAVQTAKFRSGTLEPVAGEAVTIRPTAGGFEHVETKIVKDFPLEFTKGRIPKRVHEFNDAFLSEIGADAAGNISVEGVNVFNIQMGGKGQAVHLKSIQGLVEKSGQSKKVLNTLAEKLDKEGLDAVLEAVPFQRKGFREIDLLEDQAKLIELYRTEGGFEQVKSGSGRMIRRARAPKLAEAGAEEAAATVYPDMATAQIAASSKNDIARQLLRAESTELHTVEEIARATKSADDYMKLVEKGDVEGAEAILANLDVPLNYLGGTEKVIAQTEAITTTFKKAYAAAGTRTHEKILADAAQLADKLGADGLVARLKSTVEAMEGNSVDLVIAKAHTEQITRDIVRVANAVKLSPHDVGLRTLAAEQLAVWQDLTILMARGETAAGRTLESLKIAAAEAAEAVRIGPKAVKAATGKTTTEKALAKAHRQAARDLTKAERAAGELGKLPAGKTGKEIITEMSPEEFDAYLRLWRQTDGSISSQYAMAETLKVVKLDAPVLTPKGLIEYLSNVYRMFLIAGPKTIQSIAATGAIIHGFEGAARIATGVRTMNMAKTREGIDFLVGLRMYAGDGLTAAKEAFRIGRSVTRPNSSIYVQQGSQLPKWIEWSGRLALAGDEWIRSAGARSYQRMQSLGAARAEGLTLAEQQIRVQQDMAASFPLGIKGPGLNQEALKVSGRATLSDPLGKGTFGGDMEAFIQKHPSTRWAIPFVRPSVQGLRFAHSITPGMNLLSTEYRAIMSGQMGKEAQQLFNTKQMAGGLIALGTYMGIIQGNITGDGPSDPAAREAWLIDHQPNSVRGPWAGAKWHEWTRMEPLSRIMAFLANGMETLVELDPDKDGHTGAELTTALVIAMTSAIDNQTVASGAVDALHAITAGDQDAFNRWVRKAAANTTIPKYIETLNPDPIMREVQSYLDAVQEKIPNRSTTLPAKYDFLAHPKLRAGSYFNRRISIKRSKPAVVSPLAVAMQADDIRLEPPGFLQGNKGRLNYHDKTIWSKGDQESPYSRWMQLAREGFGAQKSMEEVLLETIKDPQYTDMAGTSSVKRGGRRQDLMAARAGEVWFRAHRKMLEEYPELEAAVEADRRLFQTFIREGLPGVREVEELHGIPSP